MDLLAHGAQSVARQHHSVLSANETAHTADVGIVHGMGAAVPFAPDEFFGSGRFEFPVLAHDRAFPVEEEKGIVKALVVSFVDRISREHNRKFTLSDEALRTMMRHDWPGNVRELENSLERATALSSGPVLHLGDLPTQLQQQGLQQNFDARHAGMGDESEAAAAPGVKPLADLERDAILGAIRTLNGDKLQAARLLGIGKTTLYRKLKEYGIADPLQEE